MLKTFIKQKIQYIQRKVDILHKYEVHKELNIYLQYTLKIYVH